MEPPVVEEVSQENRSANQASPKAEETQKPVPQFPPPKTDKPRPHQCTTCLRSFARLEHLKRHERSHTKEKPFECPQCTRCFARRDLLLRHQQKLHQGGATSSRPRSGRRESTTSMAGGARRKSTVNGGLNSQNGSGNSAGMRPRANTMSTIETPGLFGLGTSSGFGASRGYGVNSGLGIQTGLGSLYSPSPLDFNSATGRFSQHTHHPSLPRLDTQSISPNIGGGLRTAPIPNSHEQFDLGKLFGMSSNTINPAQLHSSSGYLNSPTSPFSAGFPPFQNVSIDDDDAFVWPDSLDNSMMVNGGPDQAVDGSSPSAISTNSQSDFGQVMLDGSNNPASTPGAMWSGTAPFTTAAAVSSAQYTIPLDLPMDTIGPAVFPELLGEQNSQDNHLLSSSPAVVAPISPSAFPGISNQYFHPVMPFQADASSVSSNSVNGSSARQSSVTSVSTNSITDETRQALIFSLSQPSGFGHSHRKFSQPTVSSPLSPGPGFGPKPPATPVSLPSTTDLQRYVNAYIHYFHPHMPFLHIPTLTFNSPIFTSNMRSSAGFSGDGIVGGGGCLILAIAAIGALYEFEHAPARELFEAAKRMIGIYLEERRKAGLTAASTASTNHSVSSSQKTPLWLVQAMLLNLIYGHNCGDKQAAEIATTHCAALVSLAKAAELERPDPQAAAEEARLNGGIPRAYMNSNVEMRDDSTSPENGWGGFSSQESHELQEKWYLWKSSEERKRTLFSVYVLSSLLVTAYNHPPRILNSEIHLDLPCEEDLYAADNAQTWAALGGAVVMETKQVTFSEALSYLLTASQRQPRENGSFASYKSPFGSSVPLHEVPESDLKPSTFGCYILINALHVYIWETRQRHNGRQWKPQETDLMHAQVEPALRAWQSAWKSNPHHSLERPNPYGPLPADSIPLLDLAYVRLFVNLGRSKEEFFRRDFEAMARELGLGVEMIQHAEPSENGSYDSSDPASATTTNSSPRNLVSPSPGQMNSNTGEKAVGEVVPQPSSRRERHLRKAAAYAADSLCMADKLGVTFADFTSRELPLQSAMCTFDCAQVLAEWLAVVQERVGKYMGILGRDDVDLSTVPAVVLLMDEDIRLLEKVSQYLQSADVKMAADMTTMPSAPMANWRHAGYGSRLLLVTAYMMEKSAVWPVTHTMARALETHASYLQQRAEASLLV